MLVAWVVRGGAANASPSAVEVGLLTAWVRSDGGGLVHRTASSGGAYLVVFPGEATSEPGQAWFDTRWSELIAGKARVQPTGDRQEGAGKDGTVMLQGASFED